MPVVTFNFYQLFSSEVEQPVFFIKNFGKGKKGGWNCRLINYFQLLFLIKCMVSLLCKGGCVATVLVLPERTHSASSSSKCHIPASTRHVTTGRRTKTSSVREKVLQSALKVKIHQFQVQQRKPYGCLFII